MLKNKLTLLFYISFLFIHLSLYSDNFIIADAENDVGANDRINFTKLQASGLTDGLSISYSSTKDINISEKDKNIFLFIDTDLNSGTGYKGEKLPLGADYMLQGRTLYKFSGQSAGEWKWTEIEVLKNTANKDTAFTAFIPFKSLNLAPLSAIALTLQGKNIGGIDDMAPELMNGPLHVISGEDSEMETRDFVTVSGDCLVFKDIAGDALPGSHADFTGGEIRFLNGGLFIKYSAANKLDWKKNSSSYNLFIDSDDSSKTGYSLSGDMYAPGADYMLRGNALFRFSGKNKNEWKWDKVCDLPYKTDEKTCSINLKLSDIQKVPGRMRFQFRADDGIYHDFMPELNTKAMVLMPGNLAISPETSVNTSNSASQYSSSALTDGQISSNLPWQIAAWASMKDKQDKWVGFRFQKAQKPSLMKIYWVEKSGKISIQYLVEEKWETVKEVTNGKNTALSCVELPKTETPLKAVRILQKPGDGPEKRTDTMWIREIEIY